MFRRNFLREGCRRFRTLRFRPQRGLRNTVWIAYSGVFRDGFAVPSHFYGSLAQLVQSICLTSRGSGVRIPQLPLRRKTIGFPIVFFRLSASESRLPPLCQTKKKTEHGSAHSPGGCWGNVYGVARRKVPPASPDFKRSPRDGAAIRIPQLPLRRKTIGFPIVFFLFVRVGRKTFPGNRSCFAVNIGFFRNTFL